MLSQETASLLLPPQIPHVKKLVDSLNTNGFAKDFSQMGTGKTYSACATLKEVNAPFLIICPKAVIVPWQRVCESFNITPIAIINYEKIIRGGTKYYEYANVHIGKFGVINGKRVPVTSEVGRFKNLPENAVIVFDEVHKCKAMESSSSRLLIAAKDQNFKRLKLSGSAATSTLEMLALGYSSGLHNHVLSNDFKRKFCVDHGCEWTGMHGQMTFDPESDKGRKAMRTINDTFFNIQKSASRLTVEQMGTYFPETQVLPLALDMGANGKKIDSVYNQMQREIGLLDERTKNYSSHVFAILMKARRHAEILKVPTFVNEIETAIAEGNSVAAFFNFTETIDAIVERLDKNKSTHGKIARVVGGQSTSERQREIDDFQSDKKTIILCNMKAGSTGISLHDMNGNRARVALVSPGFSAIELIQALSRVHRQGGKTKSRQRVVFCAGTIEESACSRLQYRIDNLAALNDGDLTSDIQFYGNKYSYNFDNQD